jgi:hypothetical protein
MSIYNSGAEEERTISGSAREACEDPSRMADEEPISATVSAPPFHMASLVHCRTRSRGSSRLTMG